MSLDLPSEPEEESSDWLSDLRGEESSDPESEDSSTEKTSFDNQGPISDSPSGGDAAEWLESIHDEESQEGSSTPKPSISDQEESSEDPDWLKNIRDAESQDLVEDDISSEPPSEPEEGENPDWLKNIRDQEAQHPSTDASSVDQPAFSSDPLEIEPQILPAKSEEGESPDWLGGLGDINETKSDSDAPDWMPDPASIDETIQIDETLQLDKDADQFKTLDTPREDIPSELPTETLDSMEKSEDLDSGAELSGSQTSQLSSGQESAAASVDKEFPDLPKEDDEGKPKAPSWLTSVITDTTEIAESNDSPAVFDDDATLRIPSLQSDELDEIPTELPAWLADPNAPEDDPITEATEDASLDESEEDKEPEVDPGELPNWLDAMRPVESKSSSPPLPEIIPTPNQVQESESPPEVILAPDQTPEAQKIPEPVPAPDQTLEGQKTPESSLPIPAPTTTEIREIPESSAEETVGPLAGLRGVLPAEPEIVQFGKPPIFSLKLEVTENNTANAILLEELIETESEVIPYRVSSSALPQRLFKWVISILLFLTAFLSVISGSASVAPPPTNSIPREVQDFHILVRDIPPQTPVLLAFDYQPGLSGELEMSAAAAVDHLILQGAQLAIVSTSPTGAPLAENFLTKTQSSHGYIRENLYRNLGYLSGGPSALLHFSQSPRQAIPLFIRQGEIDISVWDLPPLQGIQSLRDFGLVVVITDDPDTARSWIEQVQPSLVDEFNPLLNTPLIMIASAQAEPLVRPYYETSPKKINGLITSVSGGAYYQLFTGRDSLPPTYWTSLSYTLGIAIMLIIGGSIYSFITSLDAWRTQVFSRGRK